MNVRAESVGYKFGEQFRRQRCLVPADGFYEWVTEGRAKRARRFTLASGGPFAFAGLWDAWAGDGQTLTTCCLVTTAANDLVRPVHDRMPVIVRPADYAAWLAHGTPEKELLALLKPYPADEMAASVAGAAVNSPRNDGPECLGAA